MRRTATLVAFLFSVVSIVVSAESPAAVTKVDANQEKNDAARHDFGRFSFEVPKGWNVVKPDRDKTEAMLLIGGSTWYAAKGMIKVDTSKPAAPTPKALADAFAKSVNATAKSQDAELDGVAAARLDTGKRMVAEPGIFVAAMREKRAYLLMGAAAQDADLDAAIETIQKTWQWSDGAGEQ